MCAHVYAHVVRKCHIGGGAGVGRGWGRGRANTKSNSPGPQLTMHFMALMARLHCHQGRKGLRIYIPKYPRRKWIPRMRARMGSPA